MGKEEKDKPVEKKVEWRANPKIIMVIRKNAEGEYDKKPREQKKASAECADEDGADTE